MEKNSGTKNVSFPILHSVWKFQQDQTNSLNKEMGGKGGPPSKFDFFNVYFHYIFIYISNTYLPIFKLY